MGRGAYTYWTATCAGGINEQKELARPHQCAEALNVWAPAGRIESRPGFWGIGTPFARSTDFEDTSVVWAYEDTSTSTVTVSVAAAVSLSSAQARTASDDPDYWYLGLNSTGLSGLRGVAVTLSATNSNSIKYKIEYWNGTTWRYLDSSVEFSTSDTSNPCPGVTTVYTNSPASTHLDASIPRWNLNGPSDWTESDLVDTGSSTTYTRYWLRFTLLEGSDSTLDASVTLTGAVTNNSTTVVRGVFSAQFPSTKKIAAIGFRGIVSNIPTGFLVYSESLPGGEGFQWQIVDVNENEPASFAVLPEFNDIYIAYDYRAFVLHGTGQMETGPVLASVEGRDYLVGDSETFSSAYFDKNLVPQEEEWPPAKYIMFFKGILWAANLRDNPFQIRWSGPIPFYRVWPSLQTESLMEDDNSPITALNALGEYPVVFKNDSVWQMTYLGQDDQNLTTWAPIRVVAGTGCVSNSSVQKIRGRLIFLAEDGIYLYDGTPNITKATEDRTTGADRLADTIRRITPGRRSYSSGVHWKTHSMYLLAVSLDGSETNSHVIAWDYKNDTWWLWDNIQAQVWIKDESESDDEILYFGDQLGRIFQFGVGRTDNGAAISAHVLTHPANQESYQKITPRLVRLQSLNKARTATIEVRPNDNDVDPPSGSVVLTDPNEKDWGTLIFGTDTYSGGRERHRNLHFRKGLTCDWFQVKISHNTKDQPFTMDRIAVGMVKHGKR